MALIDCIELSKKLISCKSVTPNDDGALDVVQSALESLGFSCERMPFSEDGYATIDNLYARLGDESPNICFAGHTDVVPTGDVNDWRIDPFKPEIIDGVLYGRGVVDMKCAVACFISAVAEFLENNSPKGSISFLITGDEEDVGINGTQKILRALHERGEVIDSCIVGEPTNPDKLGQMIKIGRRGSVSFELLVWGKQGHVAYPHLADNPVGRMTDILYALNSHELDEGTDFFQPSNLEIVSVDVNNPADNVIPGVAKALFNIRFNDLHKGKSLVKWIEGICDSVCEAGDARYELKPRISGEAFITEPGPLSDVMSTAVREVTGLTPALTTDGGTSDARFVKDYCPVVEFGLMNKTAHKVDECANVDDIYNLQKVYLLALRALLA